MRIKAEADPILEIAEITDRVSKWGPRGKHGPGGPALLFENVKGYPGSKLLINQFGSERRMRMALDVDSLDEIADRIKYVHGREVAAGPARQNQDAAHAGRDGQVLSQGSFDRPVQGSHQARQLLAARLSHPAMLAAGWRPLHHAAVGHHQRSQDRQAQRPAPIACRSTTRTAPACTGSARSRAPSIIANRCGGPRQRARLIPSAPRST